MNINLSEAAVDLIINIINIVILFIIVKAFVYKPVKKFLDDRRAKVNEETSKAQKILDEANDLLKSKDTVLEETRKNAEIEAQKIFEEAKNNADIIIAEARKSAKITEEKTAEELKSQKENMLHSSKNEIAGLAVNIAERILERETNKEDTERIIDDFFKEVNL